ncbi:hypothetical protein [Propionibacterium freudenreichii]|uniref:hypothetical protein n=1 Tax=Propionibacterium freudenreichii TaxID=1744 RepID=UPI001107EA0B|nr:hypothetical protein [Propionibacterium freudenreichii]MDK9352351.1 hypothetical protein [Propionibacterium freudenreichii]
MTTTAQPDNDIELTDAQIDRLTDTQILRIINRVGGANTRELIAVATSNWRDELRAELTHPGALIDAQGSPWIVNHDQQLVSLAGYICAPDSEDIVDEFLPFTRIYSYPA